MSEEQPYDNRQQTKAGIGGCLLYPLFFLIVQPILFAYQLYTGLNPGSIMTTRVHWPDMVFNLVQLGAIVILLSLFVRKKAVLPAIFAVFLILFSLLSGVLAKVMMIVPAAGVDWWRSHLVFLLNCVILVPYFVLNTRVKNTFIHEPDRHSVVDGLIKPIADIVEQTYAWLVRQRKWIILYAFVFLIADLALNRALDWALFAIAEALSSS